MRLLVIIALIVSFSITLYVSFLLFQNKQMLGMITTQYNDVRFNPSGLLYSNKPIPHHEPYSLVFLGDSHVGDWPLSASSLLNLGISAQTSSQVRIRSDLYRDVLQGEYLLICTGGVDVLSMKHCSFSKDQLLVNFENNLNQILKNHHTKFKHLILMTIPPRFETPHSSNKQSENRSVDTTIQRFNSVIKETATMNGLLLFDAYSILSNHTATGSLSDDGIHMNRQGYSLLKDSLASIDAIKLIIQPN